MIWRVAEGSPGGLRKGGGRSSFDLTLSFWSFPGLAFVWSHSFLGTPGQLGRLLGSGGGNVVGTGLASWPLSQLCS